MAQPNFTKEEIAAFLEGKDAQEFIVGIEAPYHVAKADLIINHPEKGKYIESRSFKPFLWLKEEVVGILYEGSRKKIKIAAKKYGVKFKTLRTTDDKGFEPLRLKNGYRFLAETKQSYSSLINFFRQGGIDIYSEQHRHLFMAITPVEQFMIQTGKRLFKGIDDYDNLHRFQFDLETEGLDPKTQRIFQIGMRDNRGFEEILEVVVELTKLNADGVEVAKTNEEIEAEKDEKEREVIRNFFKVIDIIRPDVITGYNSENFDWEYFEVRCEVLGMELKNVVKTLDLEKGTFRRKDSRVKLGGETEEYKQAIMWGYSILDIWHAVRKAKAINSEIKKTSLKYITTFAKAAKPNRVYVPGDMLNKTWADKVSTFYLNDANGDWFRYLDPSAPENEGMSPTLIDPQTEKINSGDYKIVTGAYIVQRYLKDDLWETEKVDSIFNQATFLVSKILPTTFMKAATMGTAGTWKLIMMSWSYENGLALPALEPKRDFTGGLARLMEVGFAKRVCKLDYAALYPNIELTHDIFPDLDITGVMEGLLFYIVDQRDTFKFLKNDHDEMVDKTKALLKEDPTNEKLLKELKEHEYLKSMYDKKQLPLKILANSFFGSFGASYLFNWGDINLAEETTCRGRQYLRLMVRHFYEKYDFKPLVGDTDGFNFSIPDEVDDITYLVKGTHRLTEIYKGETLTGLKAVVADFNEEYMIGRMGLDIDDVCESTINFSRKNYGNLIKGKVKLVGNTIKSSKMAGYIEEFMVEGVGLLLDDKGKEFIDLYYNTVDRIFNYQIPLAKMASKSKVNQTLEDYAKYCKGKNKAGNLNSRKAFMELLIQHDIKPNLGDVVYYYNTGSAKSHGDLKTIKKDGVVESVELQCKMISASQLEKNPDLTTDEYNVAKYLESLNKRIKPLLVCFDNEIRNKIKITTKKNRKTKEIELTDRHCFTTAQCKLVSGQPYNVGDQDSYDALMTMDDKEIRFWTSVNKVPNNIDLDEWEEIKADYFNRLDSERLKSIQTEKDALTAIFKELKPIDFTSVFSDNIIPPSILKYVDLKPITNEEGKLVAIEMVSRKHDERLCLLSDMFEWEPYSILRAEFISALDVKMPYEDMLVKWEEHITHIKWSEGEDVYNDMIDTKRVEGRPIKREVDLVVKKLESNIKVDEKETPKVEETEIIEIKEDESELHYDEDDAVINF